VCPEALPQSRLDCQVGARVEGVKSKGPHNLLRKYSGGRKPLKTLD
jgi:hypothetical protein